MGKVAHWAREVGVRLVVNTSGEALQSAVEEGAYLLKPNLGELSQLVGGAALDSESAGEAARSLIARGRCDIVVVSLGPRRRVSGHARRGRAHCGAGRENA